MKKIQTVLSQTEKKKLERLKKCRVAIKYTKSEGCWHWFKRGKCLFKYSTKAGVARVLVKDLGYCNNDVAFVIRRFNRELGFKE